MSNNNNDFYSAMGYEMPDDMPNEIKSESFEYYRHPDGDYYGYFGRLIPKYKDAEGKACPPDKPGAKITHFTATLVIAKFLGNDNVKERNYVTDFAKLPEGIGQIGEVYYPLMITLDPKMQWKNIQLFEDFMLGQDFNSKIIKVNPQKPTEKFTNLKGFPLYYGHPILFSVVKTEKGNTFVSNIKLTDAMPRATIEQMRSIETLINKSIEADRAKRDSESSQQTSYTPPPPPQSDLDGMLADYNE